MPICARSMQDDVVEVVAEVGALCEHFPDALGPKSPEWRFCNGCGKAIRYNPCLKVRSAATC